MNARLLSSVAGVLALAGTAFAPTAAWAGSPDGKFQVKVLATGVLPDGAIDTVNKVSITLPAGTQTAANDNWVPTIAAEYFFSPMFSVETICCLTSHHVDGAGGAKGVNHLIDNILILPATVTLKAHADLGLVKPYIGVGPSYFIILDSKMGTGGAALGATSAKVHSKVGFALQAGVDVPVNKTGLALTLDAKRYFVRPPASFYSGTTEVLNTTHKLDPWVVSAGVAYRF